MLIITDSTAGFLIKRKRVCDKKVGILKTPLWKRGARGDFKKKLLHKIPLHPPLPKGEY